MLACWADRASLKNAPPAMLAWVGLTLLSAAVHRWATISSAAEPAWLSLFTPASHLVVMAVFVYGTAHLLRTPSRLSWLVILMVMAVAVLSVQIAFDRAASGFVYVRGGPSLPSVPQWGGIHGTSLLLTLCLPLACAANLAEYGINGLKMRPNRDQAIGCNPENSVSLRADPDERIAHRRTAAEGLVRAVIEPVAMYRQRKPIGGAQIRGVLRSQSPIIRSGGLQHDVCADAQVHNTKRRRWNC